MPKVRLCAQDQAPAPGKGMHIDLPDGVGVALFNIGGTLRAMRDSCPHMDSPIHDGIVFREIVTCRWHGWQFDARTGESLMSERIRIDIYPVSLADGAVWIDTP